MLGTTMVNRVGGEVDGGYVLVSPQLVQNLVSGRHFSRDNSVTVKFDAFGFSVKDARTRMVLHRWG